MKHFLFFSLILFHFITCSQPNNISKITWVGENKEYLNISKNKFLWQKTSQFFSDSLQQQYNITVSHSQQFCIVKYVKNSHIILSRIFEKYNSIKVEQKYNIVRFTKDTLILSPEGGDIFTISEPNEQNQYVFVNSMLTYKFEKLYYETSLKKRFEYK